VEARLKSSIQVQALVRRCDMAAIGVAVTARGDPDAGAILVKLCGRDRTATVLAQTRRADGTLGWLRATGAAPVEEGAADAYIARQRQRDPDLWVVEIETTAPDTVLNDGIIE
jgi:GMP synthase (glutamine-hydrolysing)